MIEVYKTNVIQNEQAQMLVDQIHSSFSQYKANFDLDDCDNILRVESTSGYIDSSFVIKLLDSFGFYAEALPDDEPSPDMSKTNSLVHAKMEY